jgi:hypothetical protein
MKWAKLCPAENRLLQWIETDGLRKDKLASIGMNISEADVDNILQHNNKRLSYSVSDLRLSDRTREIADLSNEVRDLSRNESINTNLKEIADWARESMKILPKEPSDVFNVVVGGKLGAVLEKAKETMLFKKGIDKLKNQDMPKSSKLLEHLEGIQVAYDQLVDPASGSVPITIHRLSTITQLTIAVADSLSIPNARMVSKH